MRLNSAITPFLLFFTSHRLVGVVQGFTATTTYTAYNKLRLSTTKLHSDDGFTWHSENSPKQNGDQIPNPVGSDNENPIAPPDTYLSNLSQSPPGPKDNDQIPNPVLSAPTVGSVKEVASPVTSDNSSNGWELPAGHRAYNGLGNDVAPPGNDVAPPVTSDTPSSGWELTPGPINIGSVVDTAAPVDISSNEVKREMKPSPKANNGIVKEVTPPVTSDTSTKQWELPTSPKASKAPLRDVAPTVPSNNSSNQRVLTPNPININPVNIGIDTSSDEVELTEELDELTLRDMDMMRTAIKLAQSGGGERGLHSPFPKPIVGAVIVTKDGKTLGTGRSTYKHHAVQEAIADAGIDATPLNEWCVTWPSNPKLRQGLRDSTLYVTLEPSAERQGADLPPITQLIQMSGIPRVVIGCPDPISELATEGAAALHSAGLTVIMGMVQTESEAIIKGYTANANSKLAVMARAHYERFKRPLGFLHCSVVDSDDVESFSRNGNSFGKDFGGKLLSSRDFGSYKLAPPPESIWANEDTSDDTEVDDFFVDFENEEEQESIGSNPMMPWYEQVDAVVATFPKKGNGYEKKDSIAERLYGLKWLATSGNCLPANVERVLVMDATDLEDLPVSNDDPNLPKEVDVEAFWRSDSRRPTRILLRHGDNAQAISAATAAAEAAMAASEAAQRAKEAIETGDAELAAEAALDCQQAALAATVALQKGMQQSQDLKLRLMDMGVKVEVLKGVDPIDVMNHLGKRSGFKSVVWRAGCWGQRGVDSIIDGAFQWVSAHIAVDATGGKFWQLMLAEGAVQGACGNERKVKILAEQEDISLEYCDEDNEDEDCVMSVDGKPIRHVRLDCRVLVVDPNRPTEYHMTKTAPVKDRLFDEAPWFL